LENQTVSVPFYNCGDAFKANAGNAGYYRNLYDPALFPKIREKINDLPPADRLNLLNDAWAMVEANRPPASAWLDLVQSLKDEKSCAVWGHVISIFEFIDGLERGQPGRDAFRDFAICQLDPQLQRLTWKSNPNEPPTDTILRSRVISTLGFFGDKAVIA